MPASSSDERTPPKGYRTRPRQLPGLACEECRSRKLGCDRRQPKCGTCQNLGIQCTQNRTHKPRGPKRGYISALQSRIAALECRLGENAETDPQSQPSEPQTRLQQDEPVELQPYSRPVRLAELDINPEHNSRLSQNQTLQQGGAQERVYAAWQRAAQHSEQSAGSVSLPSSLTSEFGGEQYKPTSPYPNLGQPAAVGPDFGSLLHTGSSVTADAPGTSSTTPNLDLPLPSFFGCTLGVTMSDLERTDLDHLYFERVHHFVPFLNRSRYFTRATRSMDATEPFTCLQHAMWTLAASMGSQFQHIQPTLYTDTRSRLEFSELDILNESIPIDQVQAWILLAIFELTQINSQRGWISAGRCFRLVHLMKLHEIDNPRPWSGLSHANLSWIEMEERRRTLWTAYSLDRYASLISQMPMTFNEQLILTRLPSPERAFQRQQSIQTEFLAQVITENGGQQPSPFAESIIMLMLSGRCLSHQLMCNAERVHDNISEDFLKRHQWLDGILSQKMQAMSTRTSADGELFDPMCLFTDMVAQATVLLLSTALESVQCDIYGSQEVINNYKEKAVLAAQRISTLAQQLAQVGYLKVHPMTPILLYICAQFSHSRDNFDARHAVHFRAMFSALRNLCPVNNLAKIFLLKISPEGSNEASSTTANFCQLSTID